MKKRILCLIDGLGSGGAERQLTGLSYLLKNEGYNVDVAYYININFYSDWLDEHGVRYICLNEGRSKIRKLLAVRKLIRENEYEVVIAYKDGATTLSCILKALGANFKLIVSERVVTQKLNLREKIKFYLYRYSDFVVPNSSTQYNFICKNFPFLKKRTVVITNFTDTNVFKQNIKRTINPVPVVLTVARIAVQKNVLHYIDAVKHLIEMGIRAEFVWYGNIEIGQNDYWDACKKKISEFGLDSIFRFYPSTNSIIKEYQKCDVFCLPSLYEGFPNVICEAMSCGIPILCSNVCDNPNIVEDGENGFLFDPKNHKEIIDALKKMLILSSQELNKMGEKSRKIALDKFSKTQFVKKYISIIESY